MVGHLPHMSPTWRDSAPSTSGLSTSSCNTQTNLPLNPCSLPPSSVAASPNYSKQQNIALPPSTASDVPRPGECLRQGATWTSLCLGAVGHPTAQQNFTSAQLSQESFPSQIPYPCLSPPGITPLTPISLPHPLDRPGEQRLGHHAMVLCLLCDPHAAPLRQRRILLVSWMCFGRI